MFTTPCGQFDLLADFGKCKRSQRGELRGFQHDGVSCRQRGRDLPGQHEQGEVPGNDLADDAARGVVGELLLEELRPAGVMIEMPRDQRNIEVAALANRFSVVHGFEHGQAARVLLHLSGDSVQITSPNVRSESLPLGKCRTPGFDGSVDVGGRSLRHAGELLAGGRVCGVEVFSGSGRSPRPIDKVAEAALVVVEPGERFFRIFRRGAVFHGNEFFSDAHKCRRGRPRPCVPVRKLGNGMAIIRRIAPGCVMLELPFDVI